MDEYQKAAGRKGRMMETDILIIGSGFAGLWAAVAARDQGAERVSLVDKGGIALSSQSKLAAGATIYALKGDDIDSWIRDFAEGQNYLSRQEMIGDMLSASAERLLKFKAWGVEYEKTPWGTNLRLPSRGLHHARMMVIPRYKNKKGGGAIIDVLLGQVKARKVRFHPKVMITSLLASCGRVAGAVGVNRMTGEPISFRAKAVILAAGDCSFRGNYACCDQVTGDAFKLAYDAGVRLSDMEYLLMNTGSSSYGFEGTGIVPRFGGGFINKFSERFMVNYHPDRDKAEVAFIVQAMAKEMAKGNGPPFYLDMSGFPCRILAKKTLMRVGGYMPINLHKLEEAGSSVFGSPQRWLPVVHTLRGGVRTDKDCMSDLPGLFAAGLSQALGPGLFNGWSSMRAMWSGERAGMAAARFVGSVGEYTPDFDESSRMMKLSLKPMERTNGINPDRVCEEIQRVIFPYTVCLVKQEERLKKALSEIQQIRREKVPAMKAGDPHELVKAHETENMALVAELFLRASIERRESRSDHFREDYPGPDNEGWLKWINIKKNGEGSASISLEPVPFEKYRFQPRRKEGLLK